MKFPANFTFLGQENYLREDTALLHHALVLSWAYQSIKQGTALSREPLQTHGHDRDIDVAIFSLHSQRRNSCLQL